MRWEWALLIVYVLPAFVLGALRHELSHAVIYKLHGARFTMWLYPHELRPRYDALGNGPIGYDRIFSLRFWHRSFRWAAVEARGGRVSSDFAAGLNSAMPLFSGLALYVLGAWLFWQWGAAGPLWLDLFLGTIVVAQGVDPMKMLTAALRPSRTDMDVNKWIALWRLPRAAVAISMLPVWAGCGSVFWFWVLPAF